MWWRRSGLGPGPERGPRRWSIRGRGLYTVVAIIVARWLSGVNCHEDAIKRLTALSITGFRISGQAKLDAWHGIDSASEWPTWLETCDPRPARSPRWITCPLRQPPRSTRTRTCLLLDSNADACRYACTGEWHSTRWAIPSPLAASLDSEDSTARSHTSWNR